VVVRGEQFVYKEEQEMPEIKNVAVDAEKHEQETRLTEAMEAELSDEQLLQLAEGSSSWGANCNSNCK
jgi:hypothetical protein